MALDAHAEDGGGALSGLLGAAGELDAAGLAAPAGLDLGLDDEQPGPAVEEVLGGGARLLGGGGDDAWQDGTPWRRKRSRAWYS
ncbi:hypothetical protein ADENT20671_0240 [Actinomyces denticolens]|nr:hypothetical protein ADENT20671_0240 [Actinomyces denticolens]